MPRPIPIAPPVTIAVRPVRSISSWTEASEDGVRVTVGEPEANDVFLAVARDWLAG